MVVLTMDAVWEAMVVAMPMGTITVMVLTTMRNDDNSDAVGCGDDGPAAEYLLWSDPSGAKSNVSAKGR